MEDGDHEHSSCYRISYNYQVMVQPQDKMLSTAMVMRSYSSEKEQEEEEGDSRRTRREDTLTVPWDPSKFDYDQVIILRTSFDLAAISAVVVVVVRGLVSWRLCGI